MTAYHPYLTPYPTLSDIRAAAERLRGKVLTTPVWRWQTGIMEQQFPTTEVWLKLELFQKTGTFKLRGALNNIEAMDAAARARGVVAVSAGNHAIAAAYTARLAGCGAKVVMPKHALPARVAACRELGAEVVLLADMHAAFAHGDALVRDEGRTMLHPYDGALTAQGTGTVGLEFMQQVPGLDAVIVPVGGGGLLGGIAAAVRQLNPECAVYGVEPYGADLMYRSLAQGAPLSLASIATVADSLGAPYTMDYSFNVCRRFVSEVVRVSDDEICLAMLHLFRDAKLVAEPAAAVATAGLLGPLRERLEGKRVGVLVCGSNIDPARFAELLARGVRLRELGTDATLAEMVQGSVQ